MKAGPEMIADQDNIYHSKRPLRITNIIYRKPAVINVTAPTPSCFHEIERRMDNIITGMLWIKKPIIISKIVKAGSKTSKEKENRKRMKVMAISLGAQYKYLFTSFVIFGVADRIRTDDIRLHRPAFCH